MIWNVSKAVNLKNLAAKENTNCAKTDLMNELCNKTAWCFKVDEFNILVGGEVVGVEKAGSRFAVAD